MSELLSIYLMQVPKSGMQEKPNKAPCDPNLDRSTIDRMLPTPRIVGLFPLACLLGCAASSSMTAPTTPPSGPLTSAPTGYWQFQTSNSVPPGAVALSGAFQTQGSQVTGIFGPGPGCSPPVTDFTGTIDSAGNLALNAPFAEAQLQFANSDTAASGTLGGGGDLCQVVGKGPVTGTQIAIAPTASLTGTFAGAITPAITTSEFGSSVGTASIVLTQSTTPNSGGQFPLSGTISFTSGACSTTTSLTGLLSGLWITLASPAGQSAVTITAATNPAASQLVAGQITITPTPCTTTSSPATYLGSLARQ
jgi:hypothetical protein